MAITVDTRQIERHEKRLKELNKRGLLFARLDTVNKAAFETQKDARLKLGQRMTLRNKWTQRSIGVIKANKTSPEAAVGSSEDYMRVQEFGGRKESSGANGVPIATSVASGEGRGAAPRQRVTRRANRIGNITLTSRGKKGGRKQRNAIAVREAIKSGKRYVFMDLARSKGIFRVYGGKRNPRIEMVQDLSRRVVVTPRNPWLKPATDLQALQLPKYYGEALARQVARLT